MKKTTLRITGGAVAAIVIGAWLRWTCPPVMTGFAVGREIGKMEGAKAARLRGTR